MCGDDLFVGVDEVDFELMSDLVFDVGFVGCYWIDEY